MNTYMHTYLEPPVFTHTYIYINELYTLFIYNAKKEKECLQTK